MTLCSGVSPPGTAAYQVRMACGSGNCSSGLAILPSVQAVLMRSHLSRGTALPTGTPAALSASISDWPRLRQ